MPEFDLNLTMVQNLTMASTIEAPSELHSYGVLVFVACVWIIVAVLGITGNTMVILTAILSEHIRTTTNVLVVNLSVADLWTCLSLPWSSVALLSNGTWPLASRIPCQIAAFMWHTGLGASLYSMAFIALNRLVKITRPLATYNRIFSPRKMVFMVALSWLVPIFVIIFPLTIGVGGLGLDLRDKTCTDDDSHSRGDEYDLAQTIGFYPIPVTTVIISYAIIYAHVRRHFKKKDPARDAVGLRAASMASMSMSTSAEAMEKREYHQGDEKKRRISRQKLTITKNLFCVFCAFTLCISPYFISLFFAINRDVFALYGATILIFNSCVNPIIYGAKHPQFKKVLRPMLLCRWQKIPQPSHTLKAILSMRQRENKT